MMNLARYGHLERSPSVPISVELVSVSIEHNGPYEPSVCAVEFADSEGFKDPSILFGIQAKMILENGFLPLLAWFPFVHYDMESDRFLCEVPTEWGWVNPYLFIKTPLKDAAAMQLLIEGMTPST
jgi:hypothetical protein